MPAPSLHRKPGTRRATGTILVLLGLLTIVLAVSAVPALPFMAAFIFAGGMAQLAGNRDDRLSAVGGLIALAAGAAVGILLPQDPRRLTPLVGGYLIAAGIPPLIAGATGESRSLGLTAAGIVSILPGILLLAGVVPGGETVYGIFVGLHLAATGTAVRTQRR